VSVPPGSISPATTTVPIAGVPSQAFEVEVDIAAGQASEVGMILQDAADGGRWVSVTWDRYRRLLLLGRETIASGSDATSTTASMPYGQADDRLRFRRLRAVR
jgi:hypothetical protein